ncbi:MAG: atpE-A [Parachlamydiales bacterium]|nr:atpE-A [Parachlamydiales bacterium]
MKGLDSGKNKIQKICDALRVETLEPAKQEAREIVENAHLQAAELIRDAKEKMQGLVSAADQEIDMKRKAFQSSLQLACRQGIELLKQKIEEEFFFKNLADFISKETADPKIIAHLVNSCLKLLQEKGIDEDLSVVIPQTITPRAMNSLLVKEFMDRLQEKSVVLGDFDGGVQIKLRDRKITIDISDRVVRELIANFIRRDFRDLVFQV